MSEPIVLAWPFTGEWLVQNSPANRVPSHGTDAFGSAHAIDFVPVGPDGRSTPRTLVGALRPLPPERFVGFGRPVLAPLAGEVTLVHDDELDHEGRRSQLLLIGYLLTQGRRARDGITGLAGNHVVISATTAGPHVVLAHLRRGTIRVTPGQRVTVGEHVADCGNTGNSTEPHLHLQATDGSDWPRAHGLPIRFRGRDGRTALPRNGEIVRV